MDESSSGHIGPSEDLCSGDVPKLVQKKSHSADASDELVAEMLEAGLVTVKTTDKFKSGLTKKSKNFSEAEKAKITEMVKGLSKYKDDDGSDISVHLSNKKSMKILKSPRKNEGSDKHKDSSFHEFLNSELMAMKSPNSCKSSSAEKRTLEFDCTKSAITPSLAPVSKDPLSKMAEEEKDGIDKDQLDVTSALENMNLTQEETKSPASKKEKKAKKKKSQSPNQSVGVQWKKIVNEEQDVQMNGGKIGSYTQLLQSMGIKKSDKQQKAPKKKQTKERSSPDLVYHQSLTEDADGPGDQQDLPVQSVELDVHAHPLLCDSTWLQQFRYEAAEAKYHQMLSRTKDKPSVLKVRWTQWKNAQDVGSKCTYEEVSNSKIEKSSVMQICDQCGRSILKNELRRHLMNHNKVSFKCDACIKCFFTEKALEQHKLAKHMDTLIVVEENSIKAAQGKKKEKKTNQEKKESLGPVEGQLSGKKKKDKKTQNVSPEIPISAKQKKKEKKGSPEQIVEPQLSAGKKKRDKNATKEQIQPGFQQLPVTFTDTTTVISVIVKKEEHRYIVGSHRKHIREIYGITGVNIEVPAKDNPSEEIVLRGDKLQVGPAVALMFSKSQQAQNEAFLGHDARPRDTVQPSPLLGQDQGKGQQQGQKAKKESKNKKHTLSSQTGVDQSNLNENINQSANRRQMSTPYVNTPQLMRGPLFNSPAQQQQLLQQQQWQQQQMQLQQQQQYQQQQNFRGQNRAQQYDKGHGGSSQLQWRQNGQMREQGHSEKCRTPDKEDRGQGNTPKSQGKRQRKKKIVFAEYLPKADVSDGLKRGTLIQGPIRINPRNFEEAYVPHPDGCSDIIICGLKDRNRALNGDIVAVHVGEEGDWKLNKDELQILEENMTKPENNDSDPEVVIESEEIVELNISQKSSKKDVEGNLAKGLSDLKVGQFNVSSQSPSKTSSPRGCSESPKKRFTSLNEVLSTGSPVLKSLFREEGKPEFKKMLQRTGKVVAIIERKHSRACTGHIKPFQDKNADKALFSPNDHRMPRIMLPISDCPANFLERPEDHAKTLYVARITDWRQDSNYADGHLAKSLGEAGEIEPETEGMLIENGVDFEEFSQEALDCLPQQSPWCIPPEEFDYRRDFRSDCVFTIDPATARDLDDALSCEDIGNGRYKVGVHIADVSFFIEENSDLDRVAAMRSTSVYLVHKVIPMLPRLLCEQLCSLNPDVDRLTFSVEWTITEDGEIEDEWFGRSVIKSCAKLAYDHAQGFIEQPDRDWTVDELPPISDKFSVGDIKTRVLNLHKIAQNMRKARMESGALRLDQVKLQYSLDQESGMPNGYWVYHQKDSNRLVEEYMLLANMAVARRINRDFPDKALLRRHPPPQEKMVENLRDLCSALGIFIDISSAGGIQRSMSNYYGDDDTSQARMQVLVALCSKPMQNAKYFCTGCIDDENLYSHYALNVPLYTHFTSPIRRYPDVMVHRLLGASLEYCDELSKSPQDIHKLAEHCNDKKTSAKRVGDLSSELFFAVFVKTAGPLEEKAMVMAVLDKAFDIFVLKLGVSKRVYCDKLPIKEKQYKRDKKVPSLTLTWQTEEGEPDIKQEITIFTVVDCVLEQGEQPLQWTAVIKRPLPISGLPMMSAGTDE